MTTTDSDLPQFDPPLKRLIDRLLAESPPLCDAKGVPVIGQTPAIDCMVMFAGGTFRGALSKTPEGLLRMLSPGADNGRAVMVEQFFDYSAVVSIGLLREVTQDQRIVLPKGSIIA